MLKLSFATARAIRIVRGNLPNSAGGGRLLSNSSEGEGNPKASAQKIKEDAIDRSSYTKEIEIKLPDLGVEGVSKLLSWNKKPGDIVNYDDVLCEIENSQFSYAMDVEDEEVGIMGNIHVPGGTEGVTAGQHLCSLWHEEDKKSDKKK